MVKKQIIGSIASIALALISVTSLVLTIPSMVSSNQIEYRITLPEETSEPIVERLQLSTELKPLTRQTKLSIKDLNCLATNVYFEALNESFAGQISVVFVVMNRVVDDRFPNSICKVVYQGRLGTEQHADDARKGKCQFSWACDGKSDTINEETDKWKRVIEVAKTAFQMYNKGFDITEGSTHYHATYVNPKWRNDRSMERTGKMDTHIFYKWG